MKTKQERLNKIKGFWALAPISKPLETVNKARKQRGEKELTPEELLDITVQNLYGELTNKQLDEIISTLKERFDDIEI